ncbi:hypothetical protein KW784_02115 [Candidatus Parcubacteria bacterium]|nr:hypothetical protein [Candidatus Parcubacteria bacterium]
MKIGIVVMWTGKRAADALADTIKRTGVELELVSEVGHTFFRPTQECDNAEAALELAKHVRRALPPVGTGLKRMLYVWADSSPTPVSIEDFAAEQGHENHRLAEENRTLRKWAAGECLELDDETPFAGSHQRDMM